MIKTSKLIEAMEEHVKQFDNFGKVLRATNPTHYKVKEYFDAATSLNEAIKKIKYALS